MNGEPSVEIRQSKDGGWMIFVDTSGLDVTIYRITGSATKYDEVSRPIFELIQGGKK